MLYKFKSPVAADVIMLKADAEELLKIIGKAPGPQGIITAEQIPAAIAALRQAVAESEAAERARQAASQSGESTPDGNPGDDTPFVEDPILLHRHAAPFIRLLEQNAAEGKDVVWGV